MPVLADAFSVFFPMVLVVLVAVVLFNLVDRLLSLCRFKQFEFDDHFDDSNIAAGFEKPVLFCFFFVHVFFLKGTHFEN